MLVTDATDVTDVTFPNFGPAPQDSDRRGPTSTDAMGLHRVYLYKSFTLYVCRVDG